MAPYVAPHIHLKPDMGPHYLFHLVLLFLNPWLLCRASTLISAGRGPSTPLQFHRCKQRCSLFRQDYVISMYTTNSCSVDDPRPVYLLSSFLIFIHVFHACNQDCCSWLDQVRACPPFYVSLGRMNTMMRMELFSKQGIPQTRDCNLFRHEPIRDRCSTCDVNHLPMH